MKRHNLSLLAARPQVELLEAREVPATVRFDYSFDTNGFFNDPTRRAVIERAAHSISSRVYDELAPIVPSGVNTWQANFFNPATNQTVTINNPVINADEIVVYLNAAPLSGGDELGLTTTGGFTASGTRSWLDNVRSRGQVGVLSNPKSDFSTWGGMITFHSGVNWSFSSSPPAPNQYDFESVALHELMHIFGFGLGEPAFTRHVVNGVFVGPSVMHVNGGVGVSVVGNPPDHWGPETSYAGQASPMRASLRQGEKRHITNLELAALNDIGWEVFTVPGVGTPSNPQGTWNNTDRLNPTGASAVTAAPVTSPVVVGNPAIVGSNPLPRGRVALGTSNAVTVIGSAGQPLLSAFPFGSNYTAGIRVASADFTNDTIPDVLAGTGPGSIATVRLLNGATGGVIASITPFESSFLGGVNVAAGDFNRDGIPDALISADQTGGPVVVIYDGASLAQGRVVELKRFFTIEDVNFRGGARIAAGDLNADGVVDLVAAAGFGGGPRIAVFNGTTVLGTPTRLAPDFFAFEQALRNGTFVTVADVDGDGRGDVVVGAGPGGSPRVTAFSGRDLLANRLTTLANFFAGGVTDTRGGVRVAAVDLNNDGLPDLITGSGEGNLRVVGYTRGELVKSTPAALLNLQPAGDSARGVFVG